MARGTNSHYALREHHELRKTVPLAPRRACARVFEIEDTPGLVDGSGALWPVVLSPGVELVPGEVVVARLSSFRPDGSGVSKYDDSGFVCSVEAVEERVPRLSPWPVHGVPPPGPGVTAEILAAIADRARVLGLNRLPETRFLASHAARRASRVRARNQALVRARNFFERRGFLACETPSLVPSGGVETYLSVFRTEYVDHRGHVVPLQLPTSPEFALKKLLCEGHPRVFQIARAFRNGGELSRWHEPEFLMLEWYRSAESMAAVMDDTRALVEALRDALGGARPLPDSWPVFRVDALVREHAGLDLSALQEPAAFRAAARASCASVNERDDWNDVFCKIFMEKVEPVLAKAQACFVTGYPEQMAALARREPGGAPFAERFEAYLFGVEICNGYQELTDSRELMSRFAATAAARPDVSRDPVFESAMAHGLPPCTGNALGLDRVVALLLGLDGISALYSTPFLSQFPAGAVAED